MKVQRKGKSGLKEPSWNTKGLAKFLKLCFQVYKDTESKRLEETARILDEEKVLAAKKAKLGL